MGVYATGTAASNTEVEQDEKVEQAETNEDIRHQEMMCALNEINKNLEYLCIYFALITDQDIRGGK